MSKQGLNEQQMERFKNYYNNRLTTTERLAFEKELELDKKLATAYDDFAESLIIAESLGVRDLMKEVVTERQSSKPKIARLVISTLAVAASLIAGFFIFSPSKPDGNELFKQYFSKYPDLYSVRAGTNNETLDKGLNAYKTEDFEVALDAFRNLNTDNDTIRLYLGTTHLYLGQLEEAQSTLKLIESPLFQETKLWYLGLSYLKSNQLDSLSFYFEPLRGTSTYGERVREILGKY